MIPKLLISGYLNVIDLTPTRLTTGYVVLTDQCCCTRKPRSYDIFISGRQCQYFKHIKTHRNRSRLCVNKTGHVRVKSRNPRTSIPTKVTLSTRNGGALGAALSMHERESQGESRLQLIVILFVMISCHTRTVSTS